MVNLLPRWCPYCHSDKVSVRPLALIFPSVGCKAYVCSDCKKEW